VRVDNNTNDQDYIPEGGDIDGRDRSAWPNWSGRIFESWLAAIIVFTRQRTMEHRPDPFEEMALYKEDPNTNRPIFARETCRLLGI